MFKIFNDNYYVDIDEIEKYINITSQTGGTEIHVNVVKYEVVKMMMEVLMMMKVLIIMIIFMMVMIKVLMMMMVIMMMMIIMMMMMTVLLLMMIMMIVIMMLNPIGIFEAVPAMGNWIHAFVNNDDIPSFEWTISDENGKHLDD